MGWNPSNQFLSETELKDIIEEERRYVTVFKGRYLLIAEPERYMNHSCDPNTRTGENGFDYAIKDIAKGEEITGDYEAEGTFLGFECMCGNKKCRKVIKSKI